jgi:hypothetical protein
MNTYTLELEIENMTDFTSVLLYAGYYKSSAEAGMKASAERYKNTKNPARYAVKTWQNGVVKEKKEYTVKEVLDLP